MEVLHKGRSMLLHVHCHVNLIFLESFSPSVCSMQMVCACTADLGHSGHVRLATQAQINWMTHPWSLWCSPYSSDLMLICALEQKHTKFCAETQKRSLVLLRQERVCERKEAKGRFRAIQGLEEGTRIWHLVQYWARGQQGQLRKESVSLNFVFGQKCGQWSSKDIVG